MPSRAGSVHSDNYSTTSSQWTTTSRRLSSKQPFAVRFMSYAAGCPRGATMVKKKTRDVSDDRSTYSGWSTGSYWNEPDVRMYWVREYDDRSYYTGSSSSSSRSDRSSSRKSKGSRQKHFNGALPRPPMPMPMPMAQPMPPSPPGPEYDYPVDGHYVPPTYEDMDGQYGGGYNPPPPPPPPMNHFPPAPAGDAPAFFDLTGQNQQGLHLNRGPPAGFRGARSVSDDDSDSGSESG